MPRFIAYIPIGEAKQLNDWIVANIPSGRVGGDKTFTVPREARAGRAKTHLVCNWGGLSQEEYDLLRAKLDGVNEGAGRRRFYDGTLNRIKDTDALENLEKERL